MHGGAGESEEEAATEKEPERGSTLAPILEDPEEELHPSEEARRVRVVKDPSAPTKAEREAHEATHLPFRIWCEDCVNGRGITHRTQESGTK